MQDHYPAVLGGALAIRHRPGGEAVEALEIDLEGLSRHLVIAYSGRSHFSAATNWQIIRGCLDGEAAVRGLFEGIAEVAAGLPDALRSGDWAAVGELVRREWSLRRHLADGVSVPAVESLLELAQSLGAWGGKACGAGGGGCVALLVPAKRREVVARSLELAGGRVLPARPTVRSLEVTGEG
jgi:D-glycero-alpha-D-manno-heptose-7-phosphate kinase